MQAVVVMRFCQFILPIILCGTTVYSQNLVPNPSFEIPPNPYNASNSIAEYWFPAGSAASLYLSEASPFTNLQLPSNVLIGYQYAYAGIACEGLDCYRENGNSFTGYLATELICPLVSGIQYRMGFFVNLANASKYAIDRIGMHISDTALSRIGGDTEVIPVVPQIENPAGNILADTVGWTEISGIYTANGGERYITIGRFYSDSETTTQQQLSSGWTRYLIDSVYVIPLNTVHADTTICAGASITLTATGSGMYHWFAGNNFADTLGFSSTLTVSPSATTTYQVQTCSSSETFVVSVITDNVSVSLGNDTAICSGDVITLTPVSANAVDYLWQDGSNTSDYTVSQAGVYWVRVNGACGGIATDTAIVSMQPPVLLSVNLGNDTLLCSGDMLTLNAASPNAINYLWQDNSTGITYEVSQAGIYWVQVASLCGNTASDSIVVDYEDCLCEAVLPSAFSPNGDHVNDEYQAVLNCSNITSFNMRIYNRWGEKLFETANPNSGWDGRYKGELQPIDVYVVYLTVNAINRMSSVSLLR